VPHSHRDRRIQLKHTVAGHLSVNDERRKTLEFQTCVDSYFVVLLFGYVDGRLIHHRFFNCVLYSIVGLNMIEIRLVEQLGFGGGDEVRAVLPAFRCITPSSSWLCDSVVITSCHWLVFAIV